MAEEIKKEEKGAGAKKALSVFLKFVLGFVFLGLAVYLLGFLHWLGLYTFRDPRLRQAVLNLSRAYHLSYS